MVCLRNDEAHHAVELASPRQLGVNGEKPASPHEQHGRVAQDGVQLCGRVRVLTDVDEVRDERGQLKQAHEPVVDVVHFLVRHGHIVHLAKLLLDQRVLAHVHSASTSTSSLLMYLNLI